LFSSYADVRSTTVFKQLQDCQYVAVTERLRANKCTCMTELLFT